MTGPGSMVAVLTLLGAVVLVVVAVVVLPALVLIRRARRRRVRELRVLAALGGSREDGADQRRGWSQVAPALREHLGARRVLVIVGGQIVVDGTDLPAGDHDTLDALGALVPDARSAAIWTRRTAPGAARAGLAARGVDEVVVVPLRSGDTPLGVLEVHDPARPWWARWEGSRLISPRRAHLRGELVLLATVARQLATAVDTSRLEARLRHDARHDPVTGLLNRAGFLEAADRHGGVAVVDFALLGQVNDALGHARGERFVTLAAERLTTACDAVRARPGSVIEPVGAVPIVGRLEGDTFAVALGEPDPAAAHRLAEQLRGRLVAPYVVEGLPFEAPVYVGVALDMGAAGSIGTIGSVDGGAPADGGSRMTMLLRRADVALVDARRGGSPVRCYEPSMGERADRRLALIRGFPGAVAHRELRVHYQPTVALVGAMSGTVLGVEALARWSHPQLGELLPDEFVPVLEATGQISELTRFVLDESLAAARSWLDAGLRLSVAVNVSVGNLADEHFPDEVAARLARHDVPAELLTLELTESGVSAEREAALPVLRRLHALGCRLAVDDFGTGQSSLAHLRRLPVDQVKIDKSFVLNMGTERGDVAVVRAIVEMGHTLGLTVVAEGVEQPAVRVALVEMGCDVAQGYLVSRPLTAVCLEAWLATLTVRPATPGREGGPLTLIA